jgi:hypothetical protein
MIACYDLARCPPTYDVVAFLAHAELERVRRGEEHIDLHVLPGPVGGFRRDSLWPRTVEERVQLRDRVLAPLCRLLPSARSVTVDRDRTAEGYGKGEYLVGLPAIVRVLEQGCRPLRAVIRNPRHYGLITFTLREAEHHPLRNSRTDEWAEAARVLGRRGHTVSVVRDAHRARESLGDVPTIASAALDISMRAQLYSHASLNVGVSNGPMWMSIFMDAPTLMLRPTTNAAGGCYDDKFYARCGIQRGAQLPASPPHQRLCWQEDTCDNIVRAVEDTLVVG